MDDDVIGTEVDGYRIEDVVGRGGMGVVYRATDVALSRTVALKRIDPAMARDDAFLRRFRSEARALARIDSPHIVGVHALRKTEIGLLIVMEFVEGGTLKDALRDGPIEWPSALPIMKQMLRALKHAHGAGVIHRDIKPQNIMLSASGTVKVTDFGLAKVHRPDDAQRTVTQGVYGTLNYMSPEQVQGGQDIDARSDLYSLGMTVYEMLAGGLPFGEDSGEFTKMRTIVEEELPRPDRVGPDLPDGLSEIVMRTLEKAPEDRYQEAEAMLADLETFEAEYSGEIDASPPHVDTEPTPADWGRWPRRVGVGALVIACLLGVYLLYTAIGGSNGNEPDGSGRGEADPARTLPSTPLTVVTQPSGARVYGDRNNFLGVTPLDTTLRAEQLQLSVEKDGYTTIDTLLRMTNEAPVDVTMNLKPVSTSLVVSTEPTNARVFVDERLIGRSPVTYTATTSSVRLRIQKEGYVPRDTVARVPQGSRPRLAVRLQKVQSEPKASVTARAMPRGRVFIDGDPTPSGQVARIPPGTYTLRFQHPQHGVKDTTVTLEGGEAVDLTCYFTHRVVVRSEPWANVYIDGANTGEPTPFVEDNMAANKSYQIGIRIRRGDYDVRGGTYRQKIGERRLPPQSFTGDTKKLQLNPSFRKQTHVIEFRVSKLDL